MSGVYGVQNEECFTQTEVLSNISVPGTDEFSGSIDGSRVFWFGLVWVDFGGGCFCFLFVCSFVLLCLTLLDLF